MKNKTALYDLIQSMSKSEKRYFTLDAQKSGRRSSRYLDLFKSINAMQDYEEEKLSRKYGKSLPTDKHYLYEAILKSMRDYNSSKSRNARIKEMILDANNLYNRGLYAQSEERLDQAKGLAQELDDQLALLEISREQLNYVWTMKQRDYGAQIDQLLADKDEHIRHINEELKYLSIAYKIQVEKEKRHPAMRRKSAPDFAQHLLEGAPHFPETAHAQRRFLQSNALLSDLIGDIDRANTYYIKMVEWWDTYPNIKAEEYNRYLADVFNLLHASYSQKKYDQFEALLQRIKGEQPGSYHDQRLIFKQMTNYQLLYHINLGVEEGYEQLLQQVEEGMAAYKLNPVSQLIMAFNITVLLLILEQPEQCQEWSEKVLFNYNRKVDSGQFRLSTLLINLLAAFNTDDIDRFDSALRAMRRAIQPQKETPMAFFKTCLLWLRKINALPPEGRRQALSEFKTALSSLKSEKTETVPLGMDDLVLNWVNSRLEGVALKDILRSQTQSQT